jgi:hypothetical protein
MSKPFYLMSDTDLLAWSNSFSAHLLASPTVYGITEGQASAYQDLNTAFDTALTAWRDPSTRTPIAMANKTAARDNLLAMAKYLVNSINSSPDTTDAQRDELGIKARKKPSPIPAPSNSPIVEVLSVAGRVVTIGLHATEGSKRGKPTNVKGASVFTFVGAVAPTDPAAWKFEGLITKTKFDLSFIGPTEASTVWVTANWFNERGETGVACNPVSINLPAASVLPQNNAMKIAA